MMMNKTGRRNVQPDYILQRRADSQTHSIILSISNFLKVNPACMRKNNFGAILIKIHIGSVVKFWWIEGHDSEHD